ncbi:MAG: LTA synthase family protein [Planctomycetota bacterium]
MGPRTRYVLGTLAVYLALGTLLRLAFYGTFQAGAQTAEFGGIAHALYVGAKFDLRLGLLLAVPFLAFSRIPILDPARTPSARGFWAGHGALVGGVLLLLYAADLGHYGYLDVRLDASSLRFLKNPIISGRMVWETYPVIWWTLGLAAATAALFFVFRALFDRAFAHAVPAVSRLSRRRRLIGTVVGVLLVCGGLYGKFSYYPLRWSDAFTTTNHFASQLALNPVLFLLDSLCTDEGKTFDEDETRESYDVVARYLGVDKPDPEGLTYVRRVRPTPGSPGAKPRPNVVVVLLESFAAHHCGAFDNPLDPSPHFDRLTKEGLLFTRFYTPRHGTARAVFASVTGLPDVVRNRTATRNPRIVSQQTVFDAMEGYDKHYFLGGSANWANIRGLLKNNIRGLTIHEEGSFTAPRVDVWGISDLHLFEEANKILREVRNESDRPFLAMIHCSGNHRPYTIPDDNRGFERREMDTAKLRDHGFIDVDEFNSFRFLDHSIGFFIEQAKKEQYFDNTVFLFYGDNGTPGRVKHMPASTEVLGLGAHHTPFLIYGPGVIQEGRRIGKPAGQCDVMATVAGLAGDECINTAIGRNLLDPRFDASPSYAYILRMKGAWVRVGILDERYYASFLPDGSDGKLHDHTAGDPGVDLAARLPERLDALRKIGVGLHRTSKWLLYHNKPGRYGQE